jgi:tetratricopeptide (TPR) repeat protein
MVRAGRFSLGFVGLRLASPVSICLRLHGAPLISLRSSCASPLALLIVGSLLAVPSGAQAQSASVQAQSLFDQGRTLLEAGQIAKACAAFEASQKLDPVATTLLNLAACREQNQQLATAWGHFIEANRMATATGNAKLAAVATRHARRLKPMLSQLKISVDEEGRPPGLEVRRGKAKVASATWGFALPVDGGTYVFTARAPGYRSWTATLSIKPASDVRTLEVPRLGKLGKDQVDQVDEPIAAKLPAPIEPKPEARPEARPEAKVVATPEPVAEQPQARPPPHQPSGSPKEPSRRSLVMPLVFGGGAVVLGGVALGLNFSGDGYYDRAKEATLQARRDELVDSANTRRHLALGSAALAAGCAGAAVYFYLRGGREARGSTETALTVTATPGHAGFAVIGGW